MSQQDFSISSPPVFSVTGQVTFKSMTSEPERKVGRLPQGIARLVSLVGIGTVLLGPLSSCDSVGSSSIPCPIPTSNAAETPTSTGTPTAKCTTSGGTHYLWIPSRGGWVQSDDGIHPDANSQGVGEDDGHSGVGDGHGGEGHGGSDGG